MYPISHVAFSGHFTSCPSHATLLPAQQLSTHSPLLSNPLKGSLLKYISLCHLILFRLRIHDQGFLSTSIVFYLPRHCSASTLAVVTYLPNYCEVVGLPQVSTVLLFFCLSLEDRGCEDCQALLSTPFGRLVDCRNVCSIHT